MQTICTFTDGALIQQQNWDGKESTITRKVKDGKLVVVSAERLVAHGAAGSRTGLRARGRGRRSFSAVGV